MGVDYKPIAGFGIEVPETEIIENFKFDIEEVSKSGIEELFDESPFTSIADLKCYGSYISGRVNYVLLMNYTEKDGIENIPSKLKKFRTFLDENGFKDKEIEFIKEIIQW